MSENATGNDFFHHQWALLIQEPLTQEELVVNNLVFDAMKLRYQDIRNNNEGLLDAAIVPLLDAINKIPGFVTTWSCSGHPETSEGGQGYFTICVNEEGIARIFDFVGRSKIFFPFDNVIFHSCGAELEENRLLLNIPTVNFAFTTIDASTREAFLAHYTEFVTAYKGE